MVLETRGLYQLVCHFLSRTVCRKRRKNDVGVLQAALSCWLEYAYISVTFGYEFYKNSVLFTSSRKIKSIIDIRNGHFTVNKPLVSYLFYHGEIAPQWAKNSSLSMIHDHT
jgi:hypothetical protein